MLFSIPKSSFTRTLFRSTRSPTFRSLHSSSSLMSSSSSSHHEPGPIEASIHEKLTTSLSPSHLSISNDSASHSHHSAMRAIGGGSGETHFTVEIVSDKFEGLRAIQRHRLVNDSLKEEFEVKGLHALAIKAKSPNELAGKTVVEGNP